MIQEYDHVKSSDLQIWLEYVDRSEEWLDTLADDFGDPRVWLQASDGESHKRNLWDETA